MGYWVSLILSFSAVVFVGIYIWKKKNNIKKGDLAAVIVFGYVALAGFVILSIDLPSAVSGGREIYINELPKVVRRGRYLSFTKTDNEELKHLKLGNWEHYEKYGHYRVRYTEPIKFVLDIEPIE